MADIGNTMASNQYSPAQNFNSSDGQWHETFGLKRAIPYDLLTPEQKAKVDIEKDKKQKQYDNATDAEKAAMDRAKAQDEKIKAEMEKKKMKEAETPTTAQKTSKKVSNKNKNKKAVEEPVDTRNWLPDSSYATVANAKPGDWVHSSTGDHEINQGDIDYAKNKLAPSAETKSEESKPAESTINSVDTNADNTTVQTNEVSSKTNNDQYIADKMEYNPNDPDSWDDITKAVNELDRRTNDEYRNNELRDHVQSIRDYVNEPGISAEERAKRSKEGNYYIWDALAKWAYNSGVDGTKEESEWQKRQSDVMAKQRELDKDAKSKIQQNSYDMLATIPGLSADKIKTEYDLNKDFYKRLANAGFTPEEQKKIIQGKIAVGKAFEGMSEAEKNAFGNYLIAVEGKNFDDTAKIRYAIQNMPELSKYIAGELDATISNNTLVAKHNKTAESYDADLQRISHELAQKGLDNYEISMILGAFKSLWGTATNTILAAQSVK